MWMRQPRGKEMLTGIFLMLLCSAVAAQAQVYTVLTTFDGKDGANPNGLIQGADGDLYGTTSYGGPNGQGEAGTVFKITTGGTLTTLYDFCAQPNCADGEQSDAALVLGKDGNFYGTTRIGGIGPVPGGGTVFKITPTGNLTTIYTFCQKTNCADGALPFGALVLGKDGNFYGTTIEGGANNLGTVFKITAAGALTTLYSFSGPDGAEPWAGLIQALDGKFYGTTMDGGTNTGCGTAGCGTFFRITKAGQLTTLYYFCSQTNCVDGSHPQSTVVQASDDNFYGTTYSGGYLKAPCTNLQGCGVVFKFSSAGVFSVLHSFRGSDGRSPTAALMQGSDGNLYGTTSAGGKAGGTIYQILLSGTLTTLHKFLRADGYEPLAGLIQISDGTFYGTDTFGGAKRGQGTVFSFVP